MLKLKDGMIGATVVAILLSLAVSPSQAGLFDFLRPKDQVTLASHATPESAASGTIAISATANQEPIASDAGLPSGWGYDSSPCFNCGESDHYIRCTQNHRRKCGQTWYPRTAPYCVAGWGWTQPCWRRMPDNYNCPRPTP